MRASVLNERRYSLRGRDVPPPAGAAGQVSLARSVSGSQPSGSIRTAVAVPENETVNVGVVE